MTTDYRQIIANSLDNCLQQVSLPGLSIKSGKVRDSYAFDDQLIIITTDRQSAFDRELALIPFKGQVLNQCSAWWFERSKPIIDNHLIACPDPNVTIAKKCEVFPVEIIVRAYITGSTNTALWTQYQQGVRNYCGNVLAEGLKKNEKLDKSIITPTTKSTHGDVPISAPEIIAQSHMSAAEWAFIEQKAFDLFAYGQQQAAEHGLILVDTKYEFGKDQQGNIILIDEVHTPDSSRYWLADSYQQRFANGEEPENIDKEFLRLWFAQHCDPYAEETLPTAPDELIIELSSRYIQLYEKISGQRFAFPNENNIEQRIIDNLSPYLP